MAGSLARRVLIYWDVDSVTGSKEPAELTILMTAQLREALTDIGYRQFYTFVPEQGGEKIIPSADIIRIEDEPI